MGYTRKNQSSLSDAEWNDLIDSINKLHESNDVNWDDFVNIHVKAMMTPEGRQWSVHGMSTDGHNFLAWHREYLLFMEERLRSFNSLVTLPYWDSYNDHEIPQQLSQQNDLNRWGVERSHHHDPAVLATPEAMDYLKNVSNFIQFQGDLEYFHNGPHLYVGEDMATAKSPNDPVFWLHHANIDRLWSIWQDSQVGTNPDNLDEQLNPAPIITRKVKDLLDIESLGYDYK